MSDELLRRNNDPRGILCTLLRRFHALGWVSGTGGGISLREGNAGEARQRFLVAPSGVQKELIAREDLFVVDGAGNILEKPSDASLKLSACTPLFLHAFQKRDAGAVLHSHSLHAMAATLISGAHFRVTQLEMIKGIAGHGYFDMLEIPILENTAHECDLADALGAAIDANPRTVAVLVRRHGVYVWGKDWQEAKVHAECLDYLFAAALEMKKLGFDASCPDRDAATSRSE